MSTMVPHAPERKAPRRTRRPKISRRLRSLIYRRDDFTCQRCQWRPSADVLASWQEGSLISVPIGMRYKKHRSYMQYRELHLDHIQPLSLGGAPRNPDNLQTLCGSCNSRKGVSCDATD